MITETIKLIFLDIAQTHSPDNDQWLKCFVHLDKSEDFNAANMSKTRKDYNNGDYWTRKTYSESTDCKQYPMLTFEWMPQNIQSVQNRTFNFNVMLNVVSTYECAEVNHMTRFQVDNNITKIMLSVIEQSKKYGLWVVEIGNELYNVWATKLQIDKWINDGKLTLVKKVCTSLLSQFNVSNIPLSKTWFGVDKLRSIQAELAFSDCDPSYDNFEYLKPSNDLPHLICKKC